MSVCRLKNGKWQVSISIAGKRIRRNFQSKAKAESFEDQARFEKLGMSGIQQKYSIKESFANYLEIDSSQNVYASKRSDIRFLCIAEFFLKSRQLTFLEDIRVEDLQHFEMWLGQPQRCGSIMKPKWSQASIVRYCKVLKAILKKAFQTGNIPKNPADIWKLKIGYVERRRPMTMAEFQKILSIAPDWYGPVLRTMALTGMRPVAIADLTWDDLDFERATIRVISRKGSSKKHKVTFIPMLPELQNLLLKKWNSLVQHEPTRSIFGTKAQIISKTGSRLIKKAGLKGVVLYGLRHALATDLLAAGVDSDIARRILGHSDLRMLQEYTSYLGTEPLAKALEMVRGKK